MTTKGHELHEPMDSHDASTALLVTVSWLRSSCARRGTPPMEWTRKRGAWSRTSSAERTATAPERSANGAAR